MAESVNHIGAPEAREPGPAGPTATTHESVHRVETLAVHAGRGDLAALGVHAAPLDLSSTNPMKSVEAGGNSYENLASGGRPAPGDTFVYQRLWNPTVARFEDGLAALEGTDEAVAFASGMAAVTACLLATVAAGHPHVVAVRPLYGGTDHLLETGLLGTSVTYTTVGGVAAAITPETGLVIAETPGNPTLDLIDIEALAAAAGDVPVLIDNTFATPVLQQPAKFGATLVLHSATKYIGGHGDAVGGVVATNSEWTRRLRQIRAITGGIMTPASAYTFHRGLMTLPVRVLAQQESAQIIASKLAGNTAVRSVLYPGLPECDPLGLVGRQMSGPGAMLAFEVEGGYEAAARVASRVRLITHAVSLGGVDTLIQHPAALTHRAVTGDAKPSAALLRLSIGLEAPEDLLADLEHALS